VFTLEDAIWRRLRLVPFPYRYSGIGDEERPGDRDKDLQLRERVRRGNEQRQAVLAWIIDGARQWYADGIGHDPDVAAVTRQWKTSEDTIGAFMGDHLTPVIDGEVTATRLYDRYKTWCADQGHRPMSNTMFGRRLCEHPTAIAHRVTKRHTRLGYVYERVRLRGDLDDVYDWEPIRGSDEDRANPLVDASCDGCDGSYVNRSRGSSSERFTNYPSHPSQTVCQVCIFGTIDDAGDCSTAHCPGF
jgi:phage/plasmid-associated DNA primase